MVKEMGSDWEPWPALHRKSNHLLFKLLVSALFIGISFRLFFSHSTTFLPVSQPPAASERTEAPVVDAGDTKPEKDSPSIEKTGASDLSVSEMASDLEEQVSQKEKKCDLFTGEWIPNPSGPAYNNETCHFIEPPQNCMKNGRPDKAYLYWKWRPRGCDLPSFNAEKFLDSMRNKSWALIGDSILRNHVQSLICLLSKVLNDLTKGNYRKSLLSTIQDLPQAPTLPPTHGIFCYDCFYDMLVLQLLLAVLSFMSFCLKTGTFPPLYICIETLYLV